MAQDINVNHPRCDPGVDRSRHVRLAGGIEPRSTTQGMGKMAAKVQQPLALCLESRRWYAGIGGHEPPIDSKISTMFTCSR
jgi:hypothetical protein